MSEPKKYAEDITDVLDRFKECFGVEAEFSLDYEGCLNLHTPLVTVEGPEGPGMYNVFEAEEAGWL